MSIKLPAVPAIDRSAADAARTRQDSLTKPQGSLGRLEEIAVRLAGIQGSVRPSFDSRHVVVAAADHGVANAGVSVYPQSVTAQMVANFLAGGAAINALAGEAGVAVVVVDAGVASDLPEDPRLRRVALARGTANFLEGPAMPLAHAEEIVTLGIALGVSLCSDGRAVVIPGEMGIGNTTAAAAVTTVLTGASPGDVTGRGTGLDEESLQRKIEVVTRAIAVNDPDLSDGLDVLAKVGGYELGFLAGLMLGAASKRGAVIVDGFISTSAALIAASLDRAVVEYMVAGHRSTEPGHTVALAHLGLEPLLELRMRLGEGTGAVVALKVIESALAAHDGMATFAEASVSGPAESVSGDGS